MREVRLSEWGVVLLRHPSAFCGCVLARQTRGASTKKKTRCGGISSRGKETLLYSSAKEWKAVEEHTSVMATGAAEKTALLVINMQKDFIHPDGLVPLNGGQQIVPSVIKAVDFARNRGILVVWVVREHDALGRDVELFRRHMYDGEKIGPAVKGRNGSELVDGLVIEEGDYKLVKTRFSAFFSTHLHSFLQGSGINSLVVVGVQTPNCIRQTVYDAVALDYQSVTVIVDSTAASTPAIHQANIVDMENIGVKVPSLREWCSSFDA